MKNFVYVAEIGVDYEGPFDTAIFAADDFESAEKYYNKLVKESRGDTQSIHKVEFGENGVREEVRFNYR